MRIASGERFGTVMQMPATEGGLGTKNLIDAIRSGTPVPGVDPLATLPDGGVVTKANVATFLPLAEPRIRRLRRNHEPRDDVRHSEPLLLGAHHPFDFPPHRRPSRVEVVTPWARQRAVH